MAWTPAKDISQYQGAWQDTGEPIVVMKAGGGDNGLYFDADCTANYNGATGAGKAVGLYWFIGWLAGATQEAAFFLKGVQPYAVGDVYALDIERGTVAVPNNAVAYVTDMVNYIHDNTGVWPLLYMNLSTLNQFDWSSLLANCGLWLADWAVSPDANIPTSATYVMQQYNDGPNYDHDAWFDTVAVFKEYGFKTPVANPVPAPAPTPVPVSTPVSTPVSVPVTTNPTPESPATPTQTPTKTNTPSSGTQASTLPSQSATPPQTQVSTRNSRLGAIFGWLKKLLAKIF